MHKHVWRKDPLTHMIHKLESAELAGWTNLCLSAVQLRQMLKNCSPVSACATLLNAMQRAHILPLSHVHTQIHIHGTKGVGKIQELHNAAGTVHRAIGCVPTVECHGNTGRALDAGVLEFN